MIREAGPKLARRDGIDRGPPPPQDEWGRRPKRAEKHVSVLDAISTLVLAGPYEAVEQTNSASSLRGAGELDAM